MVRTLKKSLFPLTAFLAILGIWLFFGGYGKAMADGPDKFDALNSLFAGLAFVGMLCTLIMQRQELSLQREELKMTREELALTRLAAQDQADIQMKALLLNTANVQLSEVIQRMDQIERNKMKAISDANITRTKKLNDHMRDAAKVKIIVLRRIRALENMLLPSYEQYGEMADEYVDSDDIDKLLS